MHKQEYLNDEHVKPFLAWMGQQLQAGSRRGHGYARPRSTPLQFTNLGAAFERYDWAFNFRRIDGRRCAGTSFAENAAVLDDLQERLRDAVAGGDDAASCDAAVEVVRWGGVAPHNEAWLRANSNGLARCLARVRDQLALGDDDAELGAGLRFNAGMTKVYSLLLDHFVIYDSRVGGALAWFVAAWVREQGGQRIPESLRFPCMPAKEDAKAARRKLRNPWLGAAGFPTLGSRPHVHARWNLRASWIVRAVLEEHPGTVFGSGAAASRRLEAALFMWGYDLTAPAPGDDAPQLSQAA
ncbi:hypothetical protein [Massilia timonae]|jgi:hypothetical protein|uniref:Uncharacterized protein n=1 Tax=Massilia timonae CCUG 45783 TaxID=883126 RepID=K9DER6_9BURK|nr:hypothetical protein [Massilia timonae]EKU81776.1 hypothetical protein HMPREF9710_02968 [Massilia timonae CCUG 45783]